jgi:hypothetical protein
MSFKNRDRYSAWQDYCKSNASVLAEIGLPETLLQSERALSDFLTTGYSDRVDLNLLEEERFWKLFKFVTTWFDLDTALFTAMETRRIQGHQK